MKFEELKKALIGRRGNEQKNLITNWKKDHVLEPRMMLELVDYLETDRDRCVLWYDCQSEENNGYSEWEFIGKLLPKMRDSTIRYGILLDYIRDKGSEGFDINCLKEGINLFDQDRQKLDLIEQWNKSKGNIFNTAEFTEKDFGDLLVCFDDNRSKEDLLVMVMKSEPNADKRLKKFVTVMKGDFSTDGSDDKEIKRWLNNLGLASVRKKDFYKLYSQEMVESVVMEVGKSQSSEAGSEARSQLAALSVRVPNNVVNDPLLAPTPLKKGSAILKPLGKI